MKGTPGFIGERLKEAREARGLTAIALADILSITRQAVSLYESGESSPQPDMLLRIADKLNLPVGFFLRPITQRNNNAIFFRSQSAASKLDRGRGNSRMKWLYEEIIPYLKKFVTFPEVELPSIDVPNDPMRLDDDAIEDIAIEVRREWGLGDGPISDVVLLMENNGFMCTRMDLGSPTLDAFSTVKQGQMPSVVDVTPYIILGSDKQSAVRSRFDASHEIGHIILHRKIEANKLNNRAEFKVIEQQANRFASAFLVPRNKFADDFNIATLNAFQTMKYKWLVSIAMFITRAYNLGFISEEHYHRLWINYNQRGWRKEEPLDDKLPIEQPLLLRRACKLIIESKIRTPEQLLSEIPLSPRDIEELMYVPPSYLAPSLPRVQLKDSKIGSSDYKSAIEEAERIINGN